MLPSIKIRPLNILSASSVNLHGITNSNVFHNNLRIRLSPLKSPILRKYTNPFKRCGMYPSISKCNAKRCKCCKHLSSYKKFGYNIDILRQTACLVVNPIKVNGFVYAYLFNCTTVGRASD